MTKPGANIDAVAALWSKGLSAPVIGARLGLTASSVLRIAQQNRDRCPPRRNLPPKAGPVG